MLADELKAQGVYVGKGTPVNWGGTLDKQTFIDMCTITKTAFHNDRPDLSNGVDREAYWTCFNGVVLVCNVEGE